MLSSYDGLTPREGAVRTSIAERRDDPRLAAVKSVSIVPVEFAPGDAGAWLAEDERALLLRELTAQLCFELSERYSIATAPAPAPADARVRTIVTSVQATGRLGSAASAASSFFIPGPIGLRAPGGLGGLAAEAEMLDGGDRQLAALTWNRTAKVVGTDNPSLSRIGDALQLAEPFADAAAAAMTPKGVKTHTPDKPDPCEAYGPRFRPEGFLTKIATGLYVPKMSGARPEKSAAAEQAPQ